MEQYISKSALLAEIERLYDEKGAFYAADVLYNLEEWIDTLEVKEVDLNEEPQVKESAEFQHVNDMCKEKGNSLTQETVINVWHDMSEEAENGRNIIIIDPKDFYGAVLRRGGSQLKNHNKERYMKWAYIDDIVNITNKEEPVSEDLGEYVNELSKQFPEVSFAKLSRIAVRVAKWQKEHLWKPANGDDLPEIDREVIALTQPYPNDEHLRVVFAHRPNKYANVWNSDLGEEQVAEIERHGKGGWNTPNV